MKDHAWMCLSAFRNRAPPEARHENTGFRVVCEIRDDDAGTPRKNE
jgi:formylglycine-generating enzyme required for sulfatase activity